MIPDLHAVAGQTVFLPQLLPVEHVASHLQDALQSMPEGHAPAAQVTSQEPGPHATPLEQALVPQFATQFDEELQSILPLHAPV